MLITLKSTGCKLLQDNYHSFHCWGCGNYICVPGQLVLVQLTPPLIWPSTSSLESLLVAPEVGLHCLQDNPKLFWKNDWNSAVSSDCSVTLHLNIFHKIHSRIWVVQESMQSAPLISTAEQRCPPEKGNRTTYLSSPKFIGIQCFQPPKVFRSINPILERN